MNILRKNKVKRLNSSTPVFLGFGKSLSARGLLSPAEACELIRKDSSSVLSATGEEFPVTELVIPASLVVVASAEGPSLAEATPPTPRLR